MDETVEAVMIRLGEFSSASLAAQISRSAGVTGRHIAAARDAGWVVQTSWAPTLYRVDGVPPVPVEVSASPERIERLRAQFARRSDRSLYADGYVFPTTAQWVDHFGRNPDLMGELVRNMVLESKLADPAVARKRGRRPKDGSLIARVDLWTYLPHRFTSLLLEGGARRTTPPRGSTTARAAGAE